MIKYLSVFIFGMNMYSLCSQTFSTEILNENNLGQKDTVVVGYDEEATILIDSQFGEQDIHQLPIGESLDIRLSQTDVNLFDYSEGIWNAEDNPSIIINQSKINIIPKSCMNFIDNATISNWPSHSTLLIPINQLPVELTWAASDFQNECLQYSFLTLWPVNTWWDTQSFQGDNPFGQTYSLSDNDRLLINEPLGHSYVTENGDSLMMLFVVLNHNESILTEVNDQIKNSLVDIYPNPVKDFLFLNTELNVDQLELIDLNGKRLWLQKFNGMLDVVEVQSGVYFVKLFSENRLVAVKRFFKQ